MKKILIILTVLLLSVGVTIGPFLFTQNANAVDVSHASWSSTSEFDNGQKVSIDTATNSCLALGNGFQLNATGGNYGATLRCPYMSPAIHRSDIVGSYDLETKTGTPSYKDFSGNGKNLFITYTSGAGAPHSYSGVLGNGIWIGEGQALAYITANQSTSHDGFFYSQTVNQFSFSGFIKLNMSGCGTDVCTLARNAGPGATQAGIIWLYWTNPVAGITSFNLRYYGNGASRTSTWSSISVDGLWHLWTLRVNYVNSSAQFFRDATSLGVNALTAPTYVPFNTNGIFIGNINIAGASSDSLRNTIDDFMFLAGWITNSEISSLVTVGSYATSGTWRSPKIFVNSTGSNGAEVETVILGYNNVSATAYISQIQILNGSDNSVIWTDLWGSPIISHTDNITYVDVPNEVIIPANGSAKVKIYLVGNGVLTPTVNFVAVTFEEKETVAPSNTPNPTLDATAIMLILLIFAFVVLFVSGFFERFAMLGAGIDCAIISVLSWAWTGNIYVATMFIFMMALCVGFAITKREK